MTKFRLTSRNGFTLIELILVLAIIALMLAVVGPRMSGLWSRSRIDNAAATTLAMMNECRQRAVNEGTSYRLVLEPDERRGWIEKRTVAGFVRPAASQGKYYEWDEALTFSADELIQDDGKWYIQFDADGTSQVAEIHISQDKQTDRVLYTRSKADGYRVWVVDDLEIVKTGGFDVPSY